MSTTHVLSVNHDEYNNELLAEFLESEGYRVSGANTLAEVDDALEDTAGIEIALIDVDGFPPEIWERCEQLRNDGVPLLVISLQPRQAEETIDEASISQIFEKPIGKQRLLDLIEQMV